MGTATSTNDLKQKLSQHIDAAKAKLDALKKDLATMHAEDMDALRQRRDERGAGFAEEQDEGEDEGDGDHVPDLALCRRPARGDGGR